MLFRREAQATVVIEKQDAPLATAGDVIAGYRLVRKLGAGPRAEVWLGHADGLATAAIKLYRADADPTSIDTEIHALAVAEHAHVVHLRDLSTTRGGHPCLILERVNRGSLAQVLAVRASFSVGEAVTILAPVLAAVGALHASGVVHGGLSAAAVLFRESGAPVLACFGRAQSIEAGASLAYLALSPLVTAERIALVSLCRSVLDRVAQARELCGWLASLETFPDAFEERVVEWLFSLGTATPVQFAPDPVSDLPPRVVRAQASIPAPPDVPLEHGTASRVQRTEETPSPWYSALVARVPEAITSRVPRSISAIRRPVWVALGITVAVLVLGLALVPDGSGSAPAPTETPAPVVAPPSPVTEDDPVTAFGALVVARDSCVRELSLLCLDGVDQSGSAAMDDDVALIRSIQKGGGGASFDATDVALVERDGDAALVSYENSRYDKPASALLVKSEAGWRIRTYLEG